MAPFAAGTFVEELEANVAPLKSGVGSFASSPLGSIARRNC